MKVLMMNVVCGIRSTGRICTDLTNVLTEKGHEVNAVFDKQINSAFEAETDEAIKER